MELSLSFSISNRPVLNSHVFSWGNKFVTTWETTAPSESITLPLTDNGTFNCTVDWGDGSAISIITAFDDVDRVHTYATAGTYTVVITGACPGWSFNNAGDKLKIRTVENWGDPSFAYLESGFYGCSGLTAIADMFNVPITSISNMFADCTALSPSGLNNWDVSGVTSPSLLFVNCSNFDGDIGGWDMSSATSTRYMLFGCTSFDQDIGGWDTSSVTNMGYMLYGCASFDQDIGGWDTSIVANMEYMLYGCTAFDQDLSGWDVTALTNAANMLNGATLSTANYDALLIGWAAQAVNSGVQFHGGNSTYTAGGAAEAAHNTLTVTHGWTITDGGSV